MTVWVSLRGEKRRSNLGSQTQRFANCVGEANLVEIATPPLREARNDNEDKGLLWYGTIHKLNNFKKILEYIDKGKRKEDS